jgi:PEP-CTERM motif
MSTRILCRIACVAIAVVTGNLWVSPSANADMRLEIASGGRGAIYTDSGNTGTLTQITSIGTFSVNVTTGTSSPPNEPPPGEVAELDLNSIDVHAGAAGTITIILENSYAGQFNPNLGALGSIGGTITSGGSVTATAFVDPTNAVPSLGSDTVGVQAVSVPGMPGSGMQDLLYTGTGSPFSATGGTTFTSTGSYSLYQELVISFGTGGGTFSADLSNIVVPEPSSLAIAGLGGLAMIGYGLRHRRKAQGALANPSTSSVE